MLRSIPSRFPAAAAVRWSLGDVIATALANHPLVGQADAETRAAVARRGQAASVRLPQVDATAGVNWAEAHSAGERGTGAIDTATTVQGTVTQLLTDFGRTGASVAAGRGTWPPPRRRAPARHAWKSSSPRRLPISMSCAP